MAEDMRKTLMPQYMKGFQCIGKYCEDSCCIGWKVNIDDSTYKKYRNIRDLQLTPLLKKHVTRNRSNSTKENFAKIRMREDNSCPFLNQEKLCSIQLKRGADYLSNVCSTYPRITKIIDGTLELSGTVSCAEVARRALLNTNLMEFDESYTNTNIKIIEVENIDTKDNKLINKVGEFFWELRIFTITLLQNRKFELWERMIILGFFYRKLQGYIDDNTVDLIPDLIIYYSDFAKQETIKESFCSMKANETMQVNILKMLAEKKFLTGVSSKRYIDCFKAFLAGVNYTSESKVEEITENYKKAYSDYYEPFMKEHEYILENYLVNYVFKNLFPLNGYNSLFDSYTMLVVHYSLIKMHLIGMSAFYKGLTLDLVIMLIQSLAKTIEHNQPYLDDISEFMRKNKLETMAYMAVLIKN